MLTDRERIQARQQALKFMPVTLEDVKPKRPRMPVGVYQRGSLYRTNVKQADGTWRLVSYPSAEAASAARLESIEKNKRP